MDLGRGTFSFQSYSFHTGLPGSSKILLLTISCTTCTATREYFQCSRMNNINTLRSAFPANTHVIKGINELMTIFYNSHTHDKRIPLLRPDASGLRRAKRITINGSLLHFFTTTPKPMTTFYNSIQKRTNG